MKSRDGFVRVVVDILDVVDCVYKHSARLKCDLRIANVMVVLGWESIPDSENLYTRSWVSMIPVWLRTDEGSAVLL